MHTDCQTLLISGGTSSGPAVAVHCKRFPLLASLSPQPVKSDKEEILWSLSNHFSGGTSLLLFKYKIYHPKVRKPQGYKNCSKFNKQLKRFIIMLNPQIG